MIQTEKKHSRTWPDRKVNMVNGAKSIEKVLVVGLGFVGQTLALKLADVGYEVYGVDASSEILDGILQAESHIGEPGLNELISKYHGKTFHVGLPEAFDAEPPTIDAIIICVGTNFPEDAEGPQLDFVKKASEWVGTHIQPGQLVIFRSTVPIGTTRSVVIPRLESCGLKAGDDFYMAYCPERTVEGAAVKELGILPQIVGPVNKASGKMAEKLFSEVTKHVVTVSSPESAEAVKLMDNTFRDVRFGFANTMAHLFENLGLDSFELIRAANYEYARNSIPVPSPGVGGSCIPKDSRFLEYSARGAGVEIPLISAAREANELMTVHMGKRIREALDLADTRVFVAGFAFKGHPETNDMRESPTVPLVADMIKAGANVVGYDPAVECEAIVATGATPVENLDDGIDGSEVCVFMTNHKEFTSITTEALIERINPGTLVVDGWGMFDRRELEAAGMNYLGVGIG